MKILVAVISYQGDAENGAHQAIRDTWGKDVALANADLRFFIGNRREDFRSSRYDEILVEQLTRTCGHDRSTAIDGCCIDFWQHEVREILRWSLEQGYDFTFLCCNDTYVIPRKLMACSFEKYDYSGVFVPRSNLPLGVKSADEIYGFHWYLWADAGAGFFVSRKAAKIALNATPDWQPYDIHLGQQFGPQIVSGELTAKKLDCIWNNVVWHYRWVEDKAYKPDSGWQQKMYKEHGADGA